MNNTKKLTSQWYNALVQSCGLESQTFQLVKGLLSTEDSLTNIWKIMIMAVSQSHHLLKLGTRTC